MRDWQQAGVWQNLHDWLHQFRRLRVRHERRADIHEAFLSIGCSLICFRRWASFC